MNRKCCYEWCNSLWYLYRWKYLLTKWLCGLHYQRLKKWYKGTNDYRHAIIEWDIAKIPLWVNAKGWYAIVDKEFAYLDKYMRSNSHWYASIWWTRRRMHPMIIWKPPKWMVTDHINRNKLDNRKENLRFCSQSENTINTDIRNDNTSWYKWLSFNKGRSSCWNYRIERQWKRFDKYFSSKEKAIEYINNIAPLELKEWIYSLTD